MLVSFCRATKSLQTLRQQGALKNVWNRAVGIEMEAAGVCAALYQMPDAPSFVMIKGICDFADAKKDDKWQAYAADAASAVDVVKKLIGLAA